MLFDGVRTLYYPRGMLKSLLRWVLGAELRQLAERLDQLERAEMLREQQTTEQLQQMQKYFARIRTREAREGGEAIAADPIKSKVLQMKFPMGG